MPLFRTFCLQLPGIQGKRQDRAIPLGHPDRAGPLRRQSDTTGTMNPNTTLSGIFGKVNMSDLPTMSKSRSTS